MTTACKWLCVLICLSLIFALVGCTDQKKNDGNDPAASDGSQPGSSDNGGSSSANTDPVTGGGDETGNGGAGNGDQHAGEWGSPFPY